MTNDATRAKAEGLPALTRRLFLRNTAAAGAVAATVAAPAIAEAAIQPERSPRDQAEWHMKELERLVFEDGASSVCVFVVGHPHNGPAGTYTRSKVLMISHRGELVDEDGMFSPEGGAA